MIVQNLGSVKIIRNITNHKKMARKGLIRGFLGMEIAENSKVFVKEKREKTNLQIKKQSNGESGV